MGRKRRRRKKRWPAAGPAGSPQKGQRAKVVKWKGKTPKKAASCDYSFGSGAYSYAKCHEIVARCPLPGDSKGALFGGEGRKLTDRHLRLHEIDLYVSLATTAYSAADGYWGEHYGWPMDDYGCWPIDILEQRAKRLAAMLKDGKRIMVACMGGHGRTGTLLGAIIAVMGDPSPVETVRMEYCEKAIETDYQEDAVKYLAGDKSLREGLLDAFGTPENPSSPPLFKGLYGDGSAFRTKTDTGTTRWDSPSGWERESGSGSSDIYLDQARNILAREAEEYEGCQEEFTWAALEDIKNSEDRAAYALNNLKPIKVDEWYSDILEQVVDFEPVRDIDECWVGLDNGDWVPATYVMNLRQWYELPI